MEKIQTKCELCNKPFSCSSLDEVTMEIGGKSLVLCKECRDKEVARLNAAFETRACKDCGATFHVTVGEMEWFNKKGWPLPVRCPECRRKRKVDRANRTLYAAAKAESSAESSAEVPAETKAE